MPTSELALALINDSEELLTPYLRSVSDSALRSRIETLIDALKSWRSSIARESGGGLGMPAILEELRRVHQTLNRMHHAVTNDDAHREGAPAILEVITTSVDDAERSAKVIRARFLLEAARSPSRPRSIKDVLERADSQFEKARAQHDKSISETLNRYSRELSERHARQQEAFETVLTGYRGKYEALISELAERDAKRQEACETVLAGCREQWQSLTGQAEADAQQLLGRLKDYDKKASALLNVIGVKGTSEGFMQAAENAKASMVTWNRITVACLSVMACWATGLALMPSLLGGSTWSVLGRLAVFTPLLLLAGYAAAQAAHARKADLQHRRTALELAAFPPFTESLPEEKAHELRTLMAKRTFGRDLASEKAGDASIALMDTVISKDLTPLIAQLVIEALKKRDKL
ncbi:hypothetical protein [Stigmatella aurantiaca]|nr:hypothetical protein [Stigmatella aurantiaca]